MPRDKPMTDSPSHRSFALVLASGGARGYAHAGVLRALEAEGLRPSAIVGVSMGAVIGTTYALRPDWYETVLGVDTSPFPSRLPTPKSGRGLPGNDSARSVPMPGSHTSRPLGGGLERGRSGTRPALSVRSQKTGIWKRGVFPLPCAPQTSKPALARFYDRGPLRKRRTPVPRFRESFRRDATATSSSSTGPTRTLPRWMWRGRSTHLWSSLSIPRSPWHLRTLRTDFRRCSGPWKSAKCATPTSASTTPTSCCGRRFAGPSTPSSLTLAASA